MTPQRTTLDEQRHSELFKGLLSPEEFRKRAKPGKRSPTLRLPLEGPIFALVEDWRRSQPKIPSRNEAIRLLLRRALERSSEKSEAGVVERDGAAEFGSSMAAANGAGLDDPR